MLVLYYKVYVLLHQPYKSTKMKFDFKEILTASMILFAVIDIVGSIPIIIDLRKKVGHIQSEKASIVAAILMLSLIHI